MYDLETNDFPRDEQGAIDSTFDDLYIPCKNNAMIRHAIRDNLSAYIPTLKRGKNIVREIEHKCGKNIIYNLDETSEEIYFEFKTSYLDEIAEIMGASKRQAKLSPFSPKNLPKGSHMVPDKDIEMYREIIKDIPFNELHQLKPLYDKFDKVIKKKFGKGYDVEAERIKASLKAREFIHSIGMWKEFLEFMKKELGKKEK